VIVKVKGLMSRMPAYEAEILWQILGKPVRIAERVTNAAFATQLPNANMSRVTKRGSPW
jgi:hypothetical protein